MFKLGFMFMITLIFGFFMGSVWTKPYRVIVSNYYEGEYTEMVFECDQAMRENFLAKAKVMRKPDKKSAQELHASELALIDCHEYDKFRKFLGSLGLTQDDLGLMGLRAIEKKGTDIESLVRIHEIRY